MTKERVELPTFRSDLAMTIEITPRPKDEDCIASKRNILLLPKDEIKTIISTPKVWCCEKNSPWEFKL
jgi:hypothetical protein